MVAMSEEPINRASLEKLSFSDLVKLADEYGVDVPEDLDRRFLIAELLELAEESNNKEDEMILDEEVISDGEIVSTVPEEELTAEDVISESEEVFPNEDLSGYDVELLGSPDPDVNLLSGTGEAYADLIPTTDDDAVALMQKEVSF